MTAASKVAAGPEVVGPTLPSADPVLRCGGGRRPGGKVTGKSPQGQRGRGPSTWGKTCGITLGRTISQRGLTATRGGPETRGRAEGDGRDLVWRMSPYERRRRGNALRGGGRDAAPEPLTWCSGQRDSGHLAARLGKQLPDTDPGRACFLGEASPWENQCWERCMRVSA